MRDIIEVRRENLRRLIKELGGPQKAAPKMGYKTSSFLVQMTGPKEEKSVSEKTARSIEAKLGLPFGMLDKDPNETSQPAPRPAIRRPQLNEDMLATVVHTVQSIITGDGLTLSSAAIADITVLAYEHALAAGEVDQDYIRRIVGLSAQR